MVAAQVGQLRPLLGRDDDAELVAVTAAAVEEGATILDITLGRIDLALRAIPGHAIPFEIAQVGVHALAPKNAGRVRRRAEG